MCVFVGVEAHPESTFSIDLETSNQERSGRNHLWKGSGRQGCLSLWMSPACRRGCPLCCLCGSWKDKSSLHFSKSWSREQGLVNPILTVKEKLKTHQLLLQELDPGSVSFPISPSALEVSIIKGFKKKDVCGKLGQAYYKPKLDFFFSGRIQNYKLPC